MMFRLLKKSSLRHGLFCLMLLTACCLFGFSILAPRNDMHSTKGPVAAPGQTSWDFGLVTAGPDLVAQFTVHNQGGRRLVLNQKSQSCACASTGTPTIVILPGASDVVIAKLKTKDIRGSVAIEVDYATNDPSRPTLTFTLLSDVHSPVEELNAEQVL
jgi:Protein of unknown function (DUF1573)